MPTKIEDISIIKGIIRECLSTDMDLVENRHHSPDKTLDGCTDYTYDTLFNIDEEIEFYSIRDDYGQLVGYFAIDSKKILRSFHVNKKFRDNGHCDKFWDAVWEITGGEFFAVIWDDNDRAKRFFENEGGEEIISENGVEFYIFNN